MVWVERPRKLLGSLVADPSTAWGRKKRAKRVSTCTFRSNSCVGELCQLKRQFCGQAGKHLCAAQKLRERHMRQCLVCKRAWSQPFCVTYDRVSCPGKQYLSGMPIFGLAIPFDSGSNVEFPGNALLLQHGARLDWKQISQLSRAKDEEDARPNGIRSYQASWCFCRFLPLLVCRVLRRVCYRRRYEPIR